MTAPPGQDPGHFTWADLIAGLVAERGSLAAVAEHLAQRRQFQEGVESVERGLRRLRTRPGDGGVWGERVLRCFGLPAAVVDRVRWMGQYHTRFTDLPVGLCAELLAPWDRPPTSESPARIWVLLGRASVAIRQALDPTPLLEQAALIAARAEPAAQAELGLVQAYAWSRTDPEATRRVLAEVEELLQTEGIAPDDRACLFARWIDQRAYPLNRPRRGAPDHLGAEALYLRIPADGPLFAQCRRHNGLGWTRLSLGDRAAALTHARHSVAAAGDAGSLRMRAMALNLLARAAEGDEAREAKARAVAIARRLEDEALWLRFDARRRRAPE